MFSGRMALAWAVLRIAAPAAGKITVIHQKPTFMIDFLIDGCGRSRCSAAGCSRYIFSI